MTSRKQDERYVIELASILVTLAKGTPAFNKALAELRTAIAFLYASHEERR